jgi:hypothetical protein
VTTSPNGAGPAAVGNPSASPPQFALGQVYYMLADWVENGIAPVDRQDGAPLNPAGPQATAPICAYPKKRTYIGGESLVSASCYSCSQ